MAPITSGELSALSDQLSIESSLTKRYGLYARACEDPQLKTKYQELAANHRSHCQALLGLLHQEERE